jgi:EpsI family protein
MIVMLGHLSNNRIAAGVDHLIYGWLFFGVVMMLMFAVGARWIEVEEGDAAASDVAAGGAPDARGGAPMWITAAVLCVVATAAAAYVSNLSAVTGDSGPELSLPGDAGGWRAIPAESSSWRPAIDGASVEARGRYESSGRMVLVHVGYFRNQRDGRKMISSDNVLVKSSDRHWRQVSAATRQVDWGGRRVAVGSARIRPESDSATVRALVVWKLYWINEALTASDAWAKVLTAWSRLRGFGDDSAVIVLAAEDEGSDSSGEHILEAFVTSAAPALEKAIRSARVAP